MEAAPSKLTRLRNWQSHEFWARLFARPLAILLLYPFADRAWVTPNRITHLANLLFAGGIACLFADRWLLAAILLNLHLVCDNMDGTLARYRRCGSAFGSIYDKLSDAIGISTMFVSLGWLAFRADPTRPHLIVVGAVMALAEMTGGYSKWVLESMRLKAARPAPPAGPSPHAVPTRSAADWARWLASSLLRVLLFEEVDYFFWVGLALILGRLDWMLYLLCGMRLLGLTYTLSNRLWAAHRMDRPA
jgi:phosphatidylglycerophosphate synthase